MENRLLANFPYWNPDFEMTPGGRLAEYMVAIVYSSTTGTVKALPQESLYLLKYGEISFWSPEPLISNPEVEREIFFSLS